MTMTLRSLFTPESLRASVREAYGLDVTRCVLLRSFVNDVYLVETPSQRYVLKVYQHGRWSVDEVTWELELTGHVAAAGVPVPQVVPLTDGRLGATLAAPEGPRPYALSAYVEEGSKPRFPFTDEIYHDFGRLVAAFHNAGDTFASNRPRRPADLTNTLTEPLALVLAALADQPDDQVVVRALGVEARRRIEGLAAAHGLDWGVCHGDVSMDNVFLSPRGQILYDFDLAAPGWRAADLTGVHSTEHWAAFAEGYSRTRPLKDSDLIALPWLSVVSGICNLWFHLVDKPAFSGTESVSEGWAENELVDLRKAAEELL